jgi:hypothetical protein
MSFLTFLYIFDDHSSDVCYFNYFLPNLKFYDMPSPKTAVIEKAIQAQKTVREIVHELGVPSKTVCGINEQLKARGTTERTSGS